ncbi:MAG: hypothetical protein HFH47_01430, partial [Bacilli bacterium]|nr:hypothetical protein [Bacilli bacterium]
MDDRKLIRKIYRKQEINDISNKLTSLGNDTNFTALSFCNIRLFTTLLIFIIIIFISNKGYLYAPFVAII